MLHCFNIGQNLYGSHLFISTACIITVSSWSMIKFFYGFVWRTTMAMFNCNRADSRLYIVWTKACQLSTAIFFPIDPTLENINKPTPLQELFCVRDWDNYKKSFTPTRLPPVTGWAHTQNDPIHCIWTHLQWINKLIYDTSIIHPIGRLGSWWAYITRIALGGNMLFNKCRIILPN